MCSRSQLTPENWKTWVTSWSTIQRRKLSLSTRRSRIAFTRLGTTKRSRGGCSTSSIETSYWPSTRCDMYPTTSPDSAASVAPVTARKGPANGPAADSRSPSRSETGSSSEASESRFTSAHSARPSRSGAGMGAEGSSSV